MTGDYLGTSGLSAMLDLSGTLRMAQWGAGNHITHRAFSVETVTGALSLTGDRIKVDTAGSTIQTVSTAPAWTSVFSGINIECAPTVIKTSDRAIRSDLGEDDEQGQN